MEILEALKKALAVRCRQEDFPEWLLPDILQVLNSPQQLRGKESLLRRLHTQIEDYDPYAGAGCFSQACSLGEIEVTLRLLKDDKGSEQF